MRKRGRKDELFLSSTVPSWPAKSTSSEWRITDDKFFLYPKGGSAGGAGKRSTQATIVVQQPSLSLDAPAATILLHPDADARRREENMRQLLDVANTLTLQEIHDFEMRWANDIDRLRHRRFILGGPRKTTRSISI